jgi:hypothetical protein
VVSGYRKDADCGYEGEEHGDADDWRKSHAKKENSEWNHPKRGDHADPRIFEGLRCVPALHGIIYNGGLVF